MNGIICGHPSRLIVKQFVNTPQNKPHWSVRNSLTNSGTCAWWTSPPPLRTTFSKPVIVLFRHGETLTLAVINRRPYKRDEGKFVLEKVTLIQDIQYSNTHRAHLEILFNLSLAVPHTKHGFTNFVELRAAWQKTLDTSALNKRFYQELANRYIRVLSEARFPKDASYMISDWVRCIDMLSSGSFSTSLTPAGRASLEQALHRPAGVASYEALRQGVRHTHGVKVQDNTLYTLVRGRFKAKCTGARPRHTQNP
jgi:hypothetical protein